MPDEGVSAAVVTAAKIIEALSNDLSTERAINAALNNQIESIQSDDRDTIQYLEKQLGALSHRNKVLEAIKLGDEKANEALKINLNANQALIDSLRAECDEYKDQHVTMHGQIKTLLEERDEYQIKFEALKKNRPNAEKHGEVLRNNATLRGENADLRRRVSDLNLEIDSLQSNLRNIRNTVERNTKSV